MGDGTTVKAAEAGDSGKYERYYYVENSSTAVGMPGCRYHVRLHIVGKWRLVDWKKISDAPALMDGSPLGPTGKYYIVGSWNDWSFVDEMTPDGTTPGVFHAQIKINGNEGEFQIVRNRDYGQTFFPSFATADGASTEKAAGPDNTDPQCVWILKGPRAAVWNVRFQRTVKDGESTASVTWEREKPAGSA